MPQKSVNVDPLVFTYSLEKPISSAPQLSSAPSAVSGSKKLQKWLFTLLKITIAVLGLWWVGHSLTWNDSAMLKAGEPGIRNVQFVKDTEVTVLSSSTLANGVTMYRVRFPSKSVRIRVGEDGQQQEMDVVIQDGAKIPGSSEELNLTREMDISADRFKEETVEGSTKGEIVHPGVRSLVVTAGAKWPLLLAAWALLVIPFVVTAIRWRNLMRPQGLNIPLGKCLQLTFVGQFYSILLPGITGGDLVKIVYAARLTGSKTKSFITIILDRVIGLVALMVIAGTSAGVQLALNIRAGVPNDNTLINVFVLIMVLLACLAAGATVYFSKRLRRLLGIEWFVEHLGSASAEQEEGRAKLEHLFRAANILLLVVAVLVGGGLALIRWGLHLPWANRNVPVVYGGIGVMALAALGALAGMALHNKLMGRARPLIGKVAEAVVGVDETLHVYRGHFGVLGWAFLISLLSQLTLPLSAWFCGMALNMTSPMTHYLAYVPVVVLAASLPISPPQGFGVMEGLLAHFFASTARAGQSFMLVQGIRFLPMLWNLVGGYWVITGRYARSQTEKPAPDGIPQATSSKPRG